MHMGIDFWQQTLDGINLSEKMVNFQHDRDSFSPRAVHHDDLQYWPCRKVCDFSLKIIPYKLFLHHSVPSYINSIPVKVKHISNNSVKIG
jgi:hypothetical protein